MLIQDESEKLTAIVEQVLRFANVEAGRSVGASEPVSVGEVLEEAIATDRRLIDESHCVLEKRVDSELPTVLGDATMLKHAFGNLISNAAKHGKGGDWIGVSAVRNGTPDRPEIEVRVQDHGNGIPADELNLVFDPFYRGRRAVADQVHGTGLGLSLTKRIIEAHHGSIAVTSEVGKGTEFIVRIPAAPASHEQ